MYVAHRNHVSIYDLKGTSDRVGHHHYQKNVRYLAQINNQQAIIVVLEDDDIFVVSEHDRTFLS